MQRLFYDDRIVEEGEVFLYEGSELPADHIAVPAESAAALGMSAPPPAPTDPPPWTTRGYVDKANRRAGADEALGDLLD